MSMNLYYSLEIEEEMAALSKISKELLQFTASAWLRFSIEKLHLLFLKMLLYRENYLPYHTRIRSIFK